MGEHARVAPRAKAASRERYAQPDGGDAHHRAAALRVVRAAARPTATPCYL